MRLSVILLLLLSSCTKPVYTVYFDTENYTEFTTEPIRQNLPGDHTLMLKVTRRCDGRVICRDSELKLEVTQESPFAFLKGKDFFIEADGQSFDLNSRRYFFKYDIKARAIDGTTGVSRERWSVWLKEEDFIKIAQAKEAWILVGEYRQTLSHQDREPWRILTDRQKLLVTMGDEDRRTYDSYTLAPVNEAEVQEKFENKTSTEAEALTWKLVSDSDNPEDFRFFLEKYPDSPYAVPAQLRLKQLERKAE